ncbi:MAG: hypothetical protein M3R69_01995 [Acidobacteriota bacterium]|nr:hypothetical protein [Acidobacteriota bacterium]
MTSNPDSGLQHGPKRQGGNEIRRLTPWLFALTVGLIGTWQFHIVQFASHFDLFPGDRGDARLVTFLLEHWYQVFRGAESWLSPPMFYPVKGVIGYADLLIGYAVPFSILRMFGVGMFEAAEAVVVLFNFVNYLVCYVLLKKFLRFNTFAAVAGAAFFAFNNPKLVQLGHLQLQPLWFMPLAIIFIVLLVERADSLTQKKAFALLFLAALSLDLQLLTGFYEGWFFTFWCFLFLVLILLFSRTRSFLLSLLTRFWPTFIASLLVFVFGLLPFFAAYLPVTQSTRGRLYEDAKPLIPVLWSFLGMSEHNYVWGHLETVVKRSHPLHPELQIGIGLVPTLGWLGLTVLAVWLIKRNRKSNGFGKDPSVGSSAQASLQQLFLALLILATTLVYIIGMRYGRDHSPWALVYFGVPGAQAIRAVARYAIMLCLPMAIAFAYFIHHGMKEISAQENRRLRNVMSAALFITVGFGLFEQFASKKTANGFSIKAENEYLKTQAANLPDNCSSFYVAVGPYAAHNEYEYQIDAALIAVMRGVPTFNGYSGQSPPNWGLWEVKSHEYEDNVKRWIEANRLKRNICRLVINEPFSNESVSTEPVDKQKSIADPVFVRQQYLDLLGREPDPKGFEDWLKPLVACGPGPDPKCDRVHLAYSILNSDEFRRSSYFVYRLYDAGLGRLPRYDEFKADRQTIRSLENGNDPAARDAFIKQWVERPEFKAVYGGLSNGAYVDKLLATAGVTMPNRDELIADLENGRKNRTDVLRLVMESPEVSQKFFSRAFVAMQFFGFLHRDPKPSEYEQRLKTLEITGDYRQLIFDFIFSTEYRRRFGQA